MTALQKFKKGKLKIGSYEVGLPGSDTYFRKTPKGIKIVGESFLFVGGTVAIIAGAFTLPGWVVVAGGIATLAGRHVAKMFSNGK